MAGDAIAGVALAALLIPESMGYAGVAGVPPEVGLYAALAAVVAYAVTGGISILVVGPASAVAALSASIVAEFTGDVDPVVLTAALAMTSGLLLIAFGLLRFGWIVNFISRPVLEAFVAGLSISIIVGQLDGLVGVEVEGDSAVSRLLDVISELDEWHGLTVAVGLGAVAALLLMERFVDRIPGAVVVVVVGIVLVAVLDLADDGVAVVGEIPQGLPELGVPDLSGTRWLELLAGGMALLLVGFSEGYAAGSAVAARTSEEVDPDQELVSGGAANLASGLAGGLAVSGSLSKTAALQAAGGRSQMANLMGGLIVLATLLFLAPLFEDLPEPVLAAVVIVAVLGSADVRPTLALRKVNRLDFAAAAVTFTLVLVWETLPAMIVGVVLSLAFVVRRVSFPDVVELQEDDDGHYRAAGYEGSPLEGSPVSAVGVLRLEAPLIYANADRLIRASRRLLAQQPTITRLVLDAEMWADLDSTGAERLAQLDDSLAENGIELHLAELHRRARVQLQRSDLARRFENRVHPTVKSAVGALGD